MKTKLFLSLVGFLLALPFISALSYGNSWNNWFYTPEYYLSNPWIIFVAIFIIAFAIIFYTVNKSFNNTPVAAVIGIGLSLLISVTASQRGWLYGYVGNDLGSWILIITFLIGFGFLIKFVHTSFGKIGTSIVIISAWFLLFITDPYQVLPYEFMTPTFVTAYEFLTSIWGFIIIAIILLVIYNLEKKDKPKFKDFFR